MLNNKRVLCLGNTERQTDELTSYYANQNQSENMGLLNSADQIISETGFYHTSVCDIGKDGVLKLAKQFDHILIFDQPIESYDCEESYHKTRHAAQLIKNRYKITTDVVDAKNS